MNSATLNGKFYFGPTNPPTPKETFSLVTSYIPPREKPAVGLVNTDWHDVIITDQFWSAAGAENYQDFIDRICLLDSACKNLVLNKVCGLSLAEKTQQILKLESRDERTNALFPNGEATDVPADILDALLSDNGVIAITIGLITLEDAGNLSTFQLNMLLSDDGIMALIEGSINIKHVAGLELFQDDEIVTKNLMTAVREGLIKPEQLIKLEINELILLLENERGVNALRENLITIERIISMHDIAVLELLLSANGITALREGLITSEMATQMREESLEAYLSDNGLTALREGLIKFEDGDVPSCCTHKIGLRTVLSDEGLKILRENRY